MINKKSNFEINAKIISLLRKEARLMTGPILNNKKKNKSKYIIIAIIACVLLIAIIVTAVIVNDSKKEIEEQSKPNEAVEQNIGEDIQETEEDASSDNKQDESTPAEENSVQETEQPKTDEENTTVGGYIEGQPEPTEPTYIDGVLIANKKHPLPSDFAPGENKEARAAFEDMAQDAKAAGFELVAFSTYRSYEYQETLYNNYVNRDGKENADRYSARPGYSEHQTGLAFDVGEKGKEDLWLTSEFGETAAGKWLVENAHKYGFILRYPEGKENITGYMYESWHFRYLGVDLATKVKESNLTLEEYLGI